MFEFGEVVEKMVFKVLFSPLFFRSDGHFVQESKTIWRSLQLVNLL